MWKTYRLWKHLAVPMLLAFGYVALRQLDEGSLLWYAGLVTVCVVGAAYVLEEVTWWIQGKGRPCPNCGTKIQMKSFRLQNSCPNCRGQL